MEKGVPIRSLSRGVAVLQAINRGGSLSMAEIARTSDVPYPTACRIVQTLLHERLIEKEPARKRYRATALVQTLAHGFQGHTALATAARPHIVDLTRRIGWPISLSTPIGHSMVMRDSTHDLSALTFNSYYPGHTFPIMECASGLVFIAYLSDEERADLFAALKLLPQSVNIHAISLFETTDFAAELREAGYATRSYNRFTRNPGKTSSIAAPIFDQNGVAGAISLAFFSTAIKMNDAIEKLAGPLKETALAVGAACRVEALAAE